MARNKRDLTAGTKNVTVPAQEQTPEKKRKSAVPEVVSLKTENIMRSVAHLALTPPADLTVSEWAERNRFLSVETAAESGLWRTSRTPYLREVMDAFNDPRVKHIVFVAASQVGKALALDTPIPIPSGWTTMGELKVGDEVFDERGEIVRVTFATEVMRDHPCYTVRFSDGEEIVADAEHRWYVTDCHEKNGRVLTTKEMTCGMRNETFFVPEVRKFCKPKRCVMMIASHASVPVRCIQVSGESHLYLAGRGMIPMHNSEAENNIIGYIIDQDPGSILFIHPNLDDAKDFSKLRIEPMIRDCPALREKVAAKKSRDSANTIRQKSFPGGVLTLTGSTEAHALASKPIRYIIGDEMDRWAESAGKEGDPWELAMARQTTFYNRKAVEVSTPTIKGHSRIAAAYSTGTQERWCSQCPHCGEYREIKWANIRFEYKENETDGGKVYNVSNIHYICPACGAVCEEAEIKKADARWEAASPTAILNGTRSFWLNAFCSPWASWESIILKFLQAKGDSKKLQVTYNTAFGELWEDRGDLQDEGDLMLRREDYGKDEAGNPVELPEGVLALTCGVDTQDDRLEFEIVGHGMFGETWGIRKGIIMGRPDDEKVWRDLDTVIDHTYTFKDGLGLKVLSTFVDEGGHFTAEVRQQCRARQGKHVFPIKGVAGAGKPFTSNPKQMRIVINKRVIGTCWTYQIGVDSGKSVIMDNLRVTAAGPKYCHFPKRDDYGARYFASLLSERLVYHEKARQTWQWEKIPGHERNEALDCRNYALAAFAVLPTDLEKTEREIKAARAKIGTPVQNTEDPVGAEVENTIARPSPEREQPQMERGETEDTIRAVLPERQPRRVNMETTRQRPKRQSRTEEW